MPLRWRPGESPYRVNWFEILELGPNVEPSIISAVCRKITTKIRHGSSHIVGGRTITEAEVNEAAARLLDERSRAMELLLIHPVPSLDSSELRKLCLAVIEQATMPRSWQSPKLTNLHALAPLLPKPSADDMSWPKWEEFAVPDAGSDEDRQYDVQFDI